MGNIKYDFTNKVVLITGGAQGIGKTTAREFSKAGANLILVDINQEINERVKEELEDVGKGRVIAIKADVGNPIDVKKMVDKSMESYGKIDILFNNAGVTRRGLLKDSTFEDFRYISRVNLDGAYNVALEVGKKMVERREGRIINVASMSAFEIQSGRKNSNYCITKAGVVMMTKAFGAEWAEYNVYVNAIAPGYTKTPVNAAMVNNPEEAIIFTSTVPIGRFAETEEMANAVLFLAAEETGYIVGETLVIDGGALTWLSGGTWSSKFKQDQG